VTLPASNGYVAYQYRHHADKKVIDLILTGSGNEVHGHVLLPGGASTADRVSVDGVSAPFRILNIERSVYVDFILSLPNVHAVNITYK
jgi:hypothetical protein